MVGLVVAAAVTGGAAGQSSVMTLNGGIVDFDTGTTAGAATFYDVAAGAFPTLRVVPGADDTQVVVTGGLTVGTAGGAPNPVVVVPASPELYRSGIAIEGVTTFSSNTLFLVRAAEPFRSDHAVRTARRGNPN